ncbi:hemin uptake protein HemP [Nitrosomonas sp.]|uniref:hemin uptake protein HemP n=1 Tax=Nitrosomonas sp. TaxID=42353 RepID=UPI0025CC6289|nr:hemin uptake protein HemP [Nitrosomonas sp.]MCC6917296.1 hemin uptake protein HemP [Nitrosomonas sp.]
MSLTDISFHTVHESGNEQFLRSAPFPIKLFSSEDLFGNSNEVLIQHRGEQYHLRLTRNNKLILTK